MRTAILNLLALSAATPVLSWDLLDARIPLPAESYGQPVVRLEVDRSSLPLGATFHARVRVVNPSGSPIAILMSIIDDSILGSGIRLDLRGPDASGHTLYQPPIYSSMPSPGRLDAKEELSRCLSYGYLLSIPGKYSARAQFHWRPSQGSSFDAGPSCTGRRWRSPTSPRRA